MAWVERNRGRFVVKERMPDGSRPSLGTFDTKTAANIFKAQTDADQSRGDFLDPRAGAVTVGEYCDQWLTGRTGRRSTKANDEIIVRLHIKPAIGDRALKDVTPSMVRQWVAAMQATPKGRRAKPLSSKTIRNNHGLLFAIMDLAVADGCIKRNPCVGTSLPEEDQPEMVFLTVQQVEQLVAAVPEHYRPLVATLAGTGLRWGEAAGLKVGRVDVLGGVLQVEQILTEVAGKLEYGPPKTKAGRRPVSLPGHVREALVPLVANRRGIEPVFTTPEGTLLRRSNFYRNVWLPGLKELGWVELGPRVHDLRHSHVAILIAGGVHPLAISKRIGHTSIAFTMKKYGHLFASVDAALIATLDAAMGTPAAALPETFAPHLPRVDA